MSEVITEPVLNQSPVTAKSFTSANNSIEWRHLEKVAFRIAFIFFALFSIPLDEGFYRYLYNLELWQLNYRHLTEIIAFYNPQFINHFSEGGFFGIESRLCC